MKYGHNADELASDNMRRTIINNIGAILLCVPLKAWGIWTPPKPPDRTVPDPDLLRTFATNSVDMSALIQMPAEEKIRYAMALAGVSMGKRNRTEADDYLNIALETARRIGIGDVPWNCLWGK